jgi:hypothetical protein
MRMDPTRKCLNCVDVEKFGVSEHPNGEFRHSNFQYHHRLALIQAHGDWLQQWLNEGWDGNLASLNIPMVNFDTPTFNTTID